MDFLTSSPSTGPHHINSEGSARVRDSLKEWRGSGGWPEENRGSEAFQHEQKRKRKEDKDAAQRTPRRMASLRAAEQVMAISKAGPARGSETTSSSQTSNSLGATSSAASSSSSPPRTSPLANVRTKRLRTQSTSPLPPPQQSTQPLTRPETNGAISGVPTSSHAQSEVEDKAVMWERRPLPSIPSSSKTDILLRPPPTLPYDSSYPPLSPNGVDQIGHPLPPPLNAPSELGKGGLDLSKQGRAGAGSGKRAIPGQELEEHLVSEIPGQKAMPWGLQKTLLQKQKGRRAGRTKMGTARRTALRESRRGKGRVGVGMGDGWGGSGSGTTEIELPKVEDDVMSETESPITAVVDPAALASHPDLPRSRLSTPVKGKQPAANSNMRRMTAAPHATTASPNKLMYASGEAVTKTDANDGVGNNEYCETCGGVGHFICCDGCPRSFHFACINPPLDINELPSVIGDASDTWYCNACRAVQKPNKGKASKSGIFGPMLQQLGEENPSIFALPADIRNYFKGVATGNDGSYVDSSMLRPIKVNKFGILDEREPLRLKDKNGKPILCYRCGESAMPTDPLPAILPATTSTSTPASSPAAKDRAGGRPSRAAAQIAHAALTPNQQSKAAEAEETASSDARRAWRKIISCDFCSLHWHLDCLDPPLANMPSLGRKWMCPNHVEHVIPSERIPKSVANSTSIHDLPLPSKETIGPGKHYRMRVVNDGRIDIIPDPMDTYTGPSHDNPEVLGSIGSSNGNSASGKANGVSSEKGNKEEAATTSVLPAYKVYPTVFGRHNNIKFKYRLPEKVVRLDFWTKAELLREQMADAALKHTHKVRRHGLDMLALVANAASYDSAENKGEMSREEDQSPMSVSAAKELVERILPDANDSNVNHPYVQPGEEPVSTLRQSFIPGEYEREFEHVTDDSTVPNVKLESMRSSELSHAPASTALDEAEVAKLQAIRQLLEYKGEGALLRFLLE